ncbi:hypothetical protein VTI74DRAFT_9421 [Chaetomium olivicolor]
MATPPAADNDLVGPVRILVQTRTQFVPGKDKDYWARIRLMENLICQHVWNCDYDRSRERARHRGCEFAYANRDCWFLVDSLFTSVKPVAEPLILWYKWTGTSFIQLNRPLPRMVLEKLQRYPFTRGSGTFSPPAQISRISGGSSCGTNWFVI